MTLAIFWIVGWFITTACAAAWVYAKYGSLAPKDDPDWNATDAQMTPFMLPLFCAFVWPAILALIVGWLIWPFMSKAREFRNRAL